MAVTDIHNTSAAASTTIAVPSMPLPLGPSADVLNADHGIDDRIDHSVDHSVDHSAESVADDRTADRSTDARLVVAARRGEADAFEALFERWFERAWNVARSVVGDDETAAEVAQDSVLKAWQRLDDLEKPESFGSWLLSITRNRALDRGRRANRSPIVEDVVVADLRDQQTQAGRSDWMASGSRSVAEAVDGYRQQEMVWAAAAALGAEDSALLDLHLRHGLSAAELAENTGSTVNAAHQRLFRLRRRLGDAIGSYVLWRGGNPLCSDLDDVIPSNEDGVRYFNRSVAALVADHVGDCHRCGADRAAILDPAALFASIPLLAIPGHLQEAAAKGLVACGVPAEATPIEKLNSMDMADVDNSLQLTRVVDGPKPPEIRRGDDAAHHLLEGDYPPVVDLSVDRPEWNPGPILSEAEISGPFTSPDVINDATDTQTWRAWLLSPAAMVGIGVGLALTVMAVVLAARPQPTTGETASGDFGVGISAGEESARARTATSGGRGQADPQATIVEASDDALDAGSVLDADSSSAASSSTGSASTASFGAAVDVGDDDDKLVARSAAGAALLTTDEQTGDTALRDLQEVLAEDASPATVTGDTQQDVASATAEVSSPPVDEAGQPVSQEGLAGGIAAAPPATSPTSSLGRGASGDDEASGVSNDRSDDDDDIRDDDSADNDSADETDDDLDDVDDDAPSTTVTSRPPTTVSPATDARPTESSNPTTTPTTSRPSTTTPATTRPPTTERVTTTPPRPTDPPTTATPTSASPVDTDDDDDHEDDIDDDVDDVDDDDVATDPGSNSSGSNNAGGSPSETRPERDSNPSDTRPDNPGRSGGGEN